MRSRTIVVALAALAVAGCGGTQQAAPPKPVPKLPHALAQSLARQADDVAAAIDAGEGCTALQRAVTLRTQVVAAVNSHQVPRRYLEPLVSTANDLAGRITCTPPAPIVTPSGSSDKPGKHDKPGKPEKHHKHDKHGHGGGD
jgi:hypothetical protein